MKTPWANVVLLILILVQAVTGYFGMVNGRISRAWILWAHGIGAYALLVLLYWKGGIILDAIRRKTVWTRRRIAFAGMFGLLLVVIGSGLLWTFSGPITLGGFSLVSLHIYLAVSLSIISVTGYQRRFTLAQASGYALALDVANAPLSHGHGFPLRLVAKDQRGVEWVKWVSHLWVNRSGKLWQFPLPLQ